MSFDLHSRVQRIGGVGNCGYRDIIIHEMTESEIDTLKRGRVLWAIFGVIIGIALATAIHWWSLAEAVAKYCHS